MLCCLANSYYCFRGSNLLQNVTNYSMTETASHPIIDMSLSTALSEPSLFKCHLFVSCLEITIITIGTNNGIVNTK